MICDKESWFSFLYFESGYSLWLMMRCMIEIHDWDSWFWFMIFKCDLWLGCWFFYLYLWALINWFINNRWEIESPSHSLPKQFHTNLHAALSEFDHKRGITRTNQVLNSATSSALANNFHANCLSSFKLSFAAIVKEKLTELREWLDMMGKRREGDDLIGPDSMTIKKQIVEMNVSTIGVVHLSSILTEWS